MRGGGRLAAALASAALVGGAAAAASAGHEALPRVAAGVIQVAPEHPARVAFAGGVTQLPGLHYAQPMGYRPLTLDLYLPPASARRPAAGYPLVIYIHGGAWMMGDPRRSGAFEDFPAVLAGIAARGYVVASVSYRLSGEARFPAQAADLRSAIRWLRGHAGDYGIDPGRAVTLGGSAGGHLAALAATSCEVKAFDAPPVPALPGGPAAQGEVAPAVSACVQGAVTWYGVFNLATISEQSRRSGLAGMSAHDAPDAPEWRLLGRAQEACRPEDVALASPAQQVSPRTPPMLLIHGTGDKTVPSQQSVEMAAALKHAGVEHRLILMPGIDHSFLGMTPEATRKATLDAYAATLDFIDRTIGPKAKR